MLLPLAWALLTALAAEGKPPAMDPDMQELAKAVRDACVAETGAAVATIEAVNAGADLPPDAALKCYIKCVMETGGMMDSGVVDVDATIALLPPELGAKMEGHLRTCGTQPGGDHCEVAYNTQRCWQQASKDDYFLI